MPAATLLCLVISISDGDTLRARCDTGTRKTTLVVRLAGIDAPEYRQAHGRQARKALSQLTLGKTAELRCRKTDDYLRSICTVWVAPSASHHLPRTLDAGHALVSQGMAWWYRAYAHEQTAQERSRYDAAEQQARARGVGLWAASHPMPPWQWRAKARMDNMAHATPPQRPTTQLP